jgi:5,10-methylenetetrahydromethanopterin reductase
LASGVFVTTPRPGGRCVVLSFGTVLGEDEDAGSDRVMDAAGHAAALIYHAMELRGAAAALPGGEQWQALLHEVPERERHLALHEGHLIQANDRDRTVLSGEILQSFGVAKSAEQWRDQLDALEAAGATEIAYQPAGHDIPGELERFMSAVA